MYVYVSKADIKASAGYEHKGNTCPIFRALNRRVPTISHVTRQAAIGGVFCKEHFRLPPIARKFIAAFDRGDAVTPIRFRIPGL